MKVKFVFLITLIPTILMCIVGIYALDIVCNALETNIIIRTLVMVCGIISCVILAMMYPHKLIKKEE